MDRHLVFHIRTVSALVKEDELEQDSNPAELSTITGDQAKTVNEEGTCLQCHNS